MQDAPSTRGRSRALLSVGVIALAALAWFAAAHLRGEGPHPAREHAGSASGAAEGRAAPSSAHEGEGALAQAGGAARAGDGEQARVRLAAADSPADEGALALDAYADGGPITRRVTATRAALAPASDDPLTRATGLTGSVTDRAGHPIAGVVVSASGAMGPGMFQRARRIGGGPDDDAPLGANETLTDAEGRWVLMGLASATPWRVHFEPPEPFLGAAQRAPTLVAGEVVDAGSTTLVRAGSIAGVVRDAEGRPVEGATVRLGEPLADGMRMFRSEEAGGAERAMVMVTVGVEVDEGPDEGPGAGEGEGAGPDPGPGASGADASSASGAPASVPGAGAPAGAVARSPRGADGAPRLPPGMLDDGAVRTDAHGRFRLTHVRPGTHVVSARKAGLRDALARGVQVEEGEERGPIELTMERALALEVTVFDAAGAPVRGASVQAAAAASPMLPTRAARRPGPGVGVTDAAGFARLEGLQALEVMLVVEAAGFVARRDPLRLSAERTSAHEVRLVREAALSGRVVREGTGEAVVGAIVLLQEHREAGIRGGPSFGMREPVRTDEDGRFRVGGLAPGLFTIALHVTGSHEPTNAGPFALGAAEEKDVGAIVIAERRALHVLVIDEATGDGLAGALVEVARDGQAGGAVHAVSIGVGAGGGGGDFVIAEGMGASVRADESGLAQVSGLAAGARLRVTAQKDGFAAQSLYGVTLPVGAVEPLAVTIALGQGGSVSGLARRASGEAWPAAPVYLLDARSPFPVAQAVADPAGHFRMESVGAGRYRLRAGQTSPSSVGAVEATDPAWFTLEGGEAVERDAHEAPRARLVGTLAHASGEPAVGYALAFGTLAPSQTGGLAVQWFGRAEGVTDAAGRFAVEPRSWGTGHGLEATSPTGARHVLALPITLDASGVNEVALVLPDAPTGRLSGSVAAIEGGPLGDARVIATRSALAVGGPAWRGETRTRADGSFTLADLPPGRYRVEAFAIGRGLEVTEVDVAGGADGAASAGSAVALALHPVGFALLHVRLADEQAAATLAGIAISVEARIDGDPHATRVRTGALDRGVAFDNLRAGARYVLTISAPGLRPVTLTASASADATPIEVTLHPAP